MTLIEQGDNSCRNYVQKLKAWLEWAYQIARENNQKESECHKKYYDHKMKCMSLRPNDLDMVCDKAPTGDHKIANGWQVTPHHVLSQLANQPIFKVQPMNVEDDENICILHRTMLFPIQSIIDSIPKTDDNHFA